MKNTFIKKAEIEHTYEIAMLHKAGIPTGFISSLNVKVIQKLYKTIVKNEIIFVLEENKKVLGFVSCAKNTGKLYKSFIKSNFFSVLPFFVLKIFSINFLRKVIETLKVPNKTKVKNDEMPELLSIVIDPNLQAKGFGKLLLDELENELKKQKIPKYKVVAGNNLISANKFYTKYGFKLSAQTELHKGAISNIYVKELDF